MPAFLDPMNIQALEDPIGAQLPSMNGAAMPALNDPAAAQAMMAMQSPISGAELPTMIQPPTTSEKLLNLGLAMIIADQQGLGLGGSIASGLKAYGDTMKSYREEKRQERMDRLAEYDLLSRIRERQTAEAAAARRVDALERAKKTNPDMADLIDLDPDMAAKTIAEGLTPKKPFEGTSMDAQTTNVLLTGDPSSPEYLAAYNIAAQPKITVGPDGVPVTVTPNMSAYRPPTYAAAGQSPAAPQASTQGGVTFGDPTASVIEGFDIAEGARPSTQDAKAVKEITEAHKNISELMAQRKALIEKDAAPIAGSKEAMLLDQNTNQLALKIKSLEQTGALDAGSVDVMMKAIGDPVVRGINDFTAPFSGISQSVTKMRGGKKLQEDMLQSGQAYIDNTLKSAVQARGYRFKAPAPPAGTPAAPVAPAAPSAPAGAIPTPRSREEFDAIPSGAQFVNPADGKIMVKK